MSDGAPRSGDEPLADVEIGVAARAKRIRFDKAPETSASFEIGPDGESDSVTERENLPERVEPGVTYRDVEVRWRGGARIVVDRSTDGRS